MQLSRAMLIVYLSYLAICINNHPHPDLYNNILVAG
jgi:hypothetical protein